jgi:transcriptional regulator of arginine metabolism
MQTLGWHKRAQTPVLTDLGTRNYLVTVMPGKRERHTAILELVNSRPVASQEELRTLLRMQGLDVTQSTLSRDVHELRLARVPTRNGVRYARADGAPNREDGRPSLEVIAPQLVTAVDGVSELLVLRTPPGSAHTLAAALDKERVPDVLGTIAGDDTILIVCRSTTARERLGKLVSEMMEAGR